MLFAQFDLRLIMIFSFFTVEQNKKKTSGPGVGTLFTRQALLHRRLTFLPYPGPPRMCSVFLRKSHSPELRVPHCCGPNFS